MSAAPPTPGDVVWYQGPEHTWRGGGRLCVVLKVGRVRAVLLDHGTLDHYDVRSRDLARARPCVIEDRRRMARRLKRRGDQLKRLGMIGDGRRAKKRLARIRDAARLLRGSG